RNDAAGTHTAQTRLESRLRAERLDGHVGAAAGEPLDFLDDVLLLEVQDYVGAHALGLLEPARDAVHADDQRGARDARARRGRDSDGSLREHDDGIADANAAALHGRKPR